MIKRFSNLSFGTKLWIGLSGYVFIGDGYAVIKDKETLTAALGKALEDPKKRWPVILFWALTTKHLFLGRFLVWLDPWAWLWGVLRVLTKVGIKEVEYA